MGEQRSACKGAGRPGGEHGERIEGTGGDRDGRGPGFGRAIAVRLAAEGAAVTVTARTQDQVDETAAQIAAAGGQAHVVVADVTNLEQVERVVLETRERFGGLTLLVSNAGVADPYGPIWSVDPNAGGTRRPRTSARRMLFLRAALGAMVEAKRGRVILVSAAAAHRTAAGLSAYCLGKSAQARASRATRRTRRRITV